LALSIINTKNTILQLILCSLSVVPLAVITGGLISEISNFIGPKKGGLLTATIGNIPELFMGLWAIRYGMTNLVKASLIGAIVSNMLLVLGISVFIGGVKYKEQRFSKIAARLNFNQLILALSAMVVLATLNRYADITEHSMIKISLLISIVLILVYLLGLIFSLYTHYNLFVISENCDKDPEINKNGTICLVLEIIFIALVLYFISQRLISSVYGFVTEYNFKEEYIGIVLIPILGNIGENFSSILAACKNKINLSVEIAIGSCLQITLFVTPLLIIYSYFTGGSLNFLFQNFHIILSGLSVIMSFLVFQDGKTYWLEGAILISIYLMIVIALYYI
ncbi:MAG: calcium/proton exchanger, partial [Bacillota bacterium]|nr:calcium/proton exchanger [Bacillota bacterium]